MRFFTAAGPSEFIELVPSKKSIFLSMIMVVQNEYLWEYFKNILTVNKDIGFCRIREGLCLSGQGLIVSGAWRGRKSLFKNRVIIVLVHG